MTEAGRELHVYLRSIARGERSSLSVLAGLVSAGSRVLDLGTGSGALGNHLREHAACTVDGVTYNEREAELARPHYRRVVVADLENPAWPFEFPGESYDFIVCADVLEHLRDPQKVLACARQLLAPGGRLLVSIPNAGYCGLIAELLQGEFSYREEGLLDRTHLRFFTRRSLVRFLADEGWAVDTVESIDRPLNQSEFKVAFERLPPAVARYLLAVPDASAYQFVVAASPGPANRVDDAGQPVQDQAAALFSAQLYVGDENGFREDNKIVVPGTVGAARQLLRFHIPSGATVGRLRLDPADRPGFLYLHGIRLLAGAEPVWQWRSDLDGLEALAAAPHRDMMLRSPWPGSTALVLLHGDDPSIELPVPAAALAACVACAQTVLEVELGWPMSADYMALVELVVPLQRQVEAMRLQSQHDHAQEAQRLEAARAQADRELGQARDEAIEARRAAAEAQAAAEQLAARQKELDAHNQSLREDKNVLVRERLRLQSERDSLARQFSALADHLRWIENSTVFRATRPLVHAKMAVERMLGLRAPEAPAPLHVPQPMEPAGDTVDVIVPVYRGLHDTQLCIRSVLASSCRTPWRLVILNDASPEPEVTQWLREVSQTDPRIVLLENERNLGFVATVNRGMSLSDQHDALLLNSDTEVANDWLDRLRHAAYSDQRIASVTPFSNNATICSYPRFCQPNELPPGWNTRSLDALFASTNAQQVVDVPTGVGFCMYIRRDCLRQVGLFDVEQFGTGYGEENDFCRRAAEAGWRNLHALDTFVLHTGGVSFGASKSQREIDAVEKMRRLHPSYDRVVHEHVMADPALTARLRVDLARVQARGLPAVLAVLHNRDGGTLRHAVELADHLRGKAVFFSLVPAPGGAVWLELMEPGAAFKLEFAVPSEWSALVATLRGLGIAHIHYHHVLGHIDAVLSLGDELNVSWDFTAHDYYAMCPRISLTDASGRYCGETGDAQCGRCETQPPSGTPDIALWRKRHGRLLEQARHVFVPSRDAGQRIARMWPAARVQWAPHTDIAAPDGLPVPQVAPLDPGRPLRIAVIGALSIIKGADLLEESAILAARQQLPLEFHLLGYAYRDLRTQPRAALTVHGAYAEQDLPRLLDWLQPDVVWFPALWPETYSYTLSACLQAGLPVIAPDLGAFPERLSGRAWSWILPWDSSAKQMVGFLSQVREQHFMTGHGPQPFVATEPGRALGAGWSYERDYLQGVAARPPAVALDTSLLATHVPGRRPGAQHQARQLKHLALSALVGLRASPLLRSVARRVPRHWQTRVKTWLVG